MRGRSALKRGAKISNSWCSSQLLVLHKCFEEHMRSQNRLTHQASLKPNLQFQCAFEFSLLASSDCFSEEAVLVYVRTRESSRGQFSVTNLGLLYLLGPTFFSILPKLNFVKSSIRIENSSTNVAYCVKRCKNEIILTRNSMM